MRLGRALIRASNFLRGSYAAVMPPSAIARAHIDHYSDPQHYRRWIDRSLNLEGLRPYEQCLLEQLECAGPILVLGCGGGREAIGFAREGREVVAVDAVPQMIDSVRALADEIGVSIRFELADLTTADWPARTFAAATLSAGQYGSIPGRRLRVEVLRRLRAALSPGGLVLITFALGPPYPNELRLLPLRRALAWLTWGNTGIQPGDQVRDLGDFHHCFQSEAEVEGEAREAGFRVVQLRSPGPGEREAAHSFAHAILESAASGSGDGDGASRLPAR
jgi:SAM-dependent methyltransferase